jgi:replicative DNA helicase
MRRPGMTVREKGGNPMVSFEKIRAFYTTHLPAAAVNGHILSAPCPFCDSKAETSPGKLIVLLNPESYFRGYFRCSHNCVPGGFHHHFSRMAGIDGKDVPGFDPDAQDQGIHVHYPAKHLNREIEGFHSLMGDDQWSYFARYGISKATLSAMKIGFNGRYLVYPYYQENGNAYVARCVLSGNEEESFWHGDETFSAQPFRLFNIADVPRCEGGALFITDGEINQLILRELGYPAIAVPGITDLPAVTPRRLDRIDHIFLLVSNTPEARMAARELAVELGYKARIVNWPSDFGRGSHLIHLAARTGTELKKHLSGMLRASSAFSPFVSPQKETRRLSEFLEKEKGKALLGLETGFSKLDGALEGLRGINIMGGPPKAGKSCFFMQISTQIAQKKTPVIYYDFENGRQKIYLRTLVRMSGLPEKQIRLGSLHQEASDLLQTAWSDLTAMLSSFRVISDRALTPDIMRRHIDFIKHETRRDDLLVVVDSLHKLPFKELSERRTGIDAWLRHFEAIRDEQQACFLIISELSRGKGGGYGERPDLSSFKESGDIEYSADNAMVLSPDWDPLKPMAEQLRKSILWLVASRENNPGLVAEYVLDYPYWRFKEL